MFTRALFLIYEHDAYNFSFTNGSLCVAVTSESIKLTIFIFSILFSYALKYRDSP